MNVRNLRQKVKGPVPNAMKLTRNLLYINGLELK